MSQRTHDLVPITASEVGFYDITAGSSDPLRFVVASFLARYKGTTLYDYCHDLSVRRRAPPGLIRRRDRGMTAALQDAPRALPPGKPVCVIDGCDRPATVRGMCGLHDYRVLFHADPHWQPPPRERKVRERKGPPAPRVCVIGGCDAPTFGKHMCQVHFVADFLNNIPADCFTRR